MVAAGWLLVAVIGLAACTISTGADEQRHPDDERATRSDAALGAAIDSDEPGCSGAVGVKARSFGRGLKASQTSSPARCSLRTRCSTSER
jgi:hypothetical protein